LQSGRRAEVDDISSEYVARDYVVRENVGQGRDVCKQAFNRSVRQSGKSVICWSEDRERTFAGQCPCKSSGRYRCDQCVESTVFDCNVNDGSAFLVGTGVGSSDEEQATATTEIAAITSAINFLFI
jgi:hypothetical protein